MDDIANAIVLEQGKTFVDAKGDVLRGLQVVEVACGITSTMLEERIEVAKDMDTYARREPLGVCAAISPFNFPAMIPLVSHILRPSLSQCVISCADHYTFLRRLFDFF